MSLPEFELPTFTFADRRLWDNVKIRAQSDLMSLLTRITSGTGAFTTIRTAGLPYNVVSDDVLITRASVGAKVTFLRNRVSIEAYDSTAGLDTVVRLVLANLDTDQRVKALSATMDEYPDVLAGAITFSWHADSTDLSEMLDMVEQQLTGFLDNSQHRKTRFQEKLRYEGSLVFMSDA